jgi:AraC-like DNA-binding protein
MANSPTEGCDPVPVTVMPTLGAPGMTRVSDRRLGTARLWRIEQLTDDPFVILPDLSGDLVWDDRVPALVPRTTTRTELPGRRATRAVGFRFPIAAEDLRVDLAWPGWSLHDPGDPEERDARLTESLADGAVTWRIDPWWEALITALDRPEVRIPQVASDLATSERSLRRTVTARLGIPPGSVAQVLRMWRFVRMVQGERLSVAAVEAGYADQSHAHREVRTLTGLRAGELAAWAAAAGDLTDSGGTADP